MDVNGTLIWYYHICKREVWLMSRNIAPDKYDTNIDIGRFLHETSYSRNKKEISFGNVKFDVLMRDRNKIIIGETKKTSRFQTASKYQLLYYLKVLEEAGLDAEGVLLYPEEKKRIDVKLDNKGRIELDEIINNINFIIELQTPPKVERNKYCKSCGYREYCYA
jgi:CRISPR-associated exonuclease Cas4